MTDIDIVFFDAGETLIHPWPSFPELFATVCRRHGHHVESEDVREIQERLAPHLIDLAEDTGVSAPSLDEADSRTFWTYLYRRLLTELGVEDDGLPGELYATFSASSSYRVFGDVVPALEELHRRGFRLGLISNFEGWLEKILVEQDISGSFEVTVISGLEGIEKPDPGIYRIAVDRASVEPARAVHVGDSMALDVIPASAIGLHAILLDRVGRYPDASCPRVASLEGLPDLVEKL